MLKPEEVQALLDAITGRLTAAALADEQERAREWLAAHRPAQR